MSARGSLNVVSRQALAMRPGVSSAFETRLGQAKKAFFDRDAVLQRAGAMKARRLGYAGSLVKLAAKRSMRRRKKTAPPGMPPSAHEGGIRDNVFSWYDPAGANGNGSAVIGPTLFGTVGFDDRGNKVPAGVPATHEYGGEVGQLQWLVPQWKRKGKGWVRDGERWERADLRRQFRTLRKYRAKRYARVTYPARPYMRPALEKIRPKFAGVFRDSL